MNNSECFLTVGSDGCPRLFFPEALRALALVKKIQAGSEGKGLMQEIYCRGLAGTWASESWACTAGLFVALFGQSHPEDRKHLFYSCTLVLFVTCKTADVCLVPWAFDVWRITELRLWAKVRSKSYWVHLILTPAFS